MDEPFLLMVAGPNGSGKTTLITALRKRGFDFGEYINPDDIADSLDGDYDGRVREAQRQADRRRAACIEARRSFSFETVMSHPDKIDILVKAKEAGFIVKLLYVGTDDPQTNVDRVALRVALGGHSVPEDKIKARWLRAMMQLHEAIRSVDDAMVFDNSIAGTAGYVPRLVFRRSTRPGKNVPISEILEPVPEWIRKYVTEPLGVFGAYSVARAQRKTLAVLPSAHSPLLVESNEQETHDTAQEESAKMEPRSVIQAANAALDKTVRAFARGDQVYGLPTGFRDIDRAINGLRGGDLIVIGGRSGMGKTALASSIAYNIASAWEAEVQASGKIETKKGGVVSFFSLEMSAEQLATRIISRQTGIPVGRIERGDITEANFEQMVKVAHEMQQIPLYIDDTGGLALEQLTARARRQRDQKNIDFVVIDNIRLLQHATTRIEHGRKTGLNEIASELKTLAKELGIPILVLSGLPSQIDIRRDKRPLLVDLSPIEEHADVVMFLYREEHYLHGREPSDSFIDWERWQAKLKASQGLAEVIIAKNRYGRVDTVSLNFESNLTRFSDVDVTDRLPDRANLSE